ncbi:MAG TPA: hypothetical protein PK323_02755 [Bacteroidia bacterium]|nr:hypothetical protein [Bacteroidia bacterium]
MLILKQAVCQNYYNMNFGYDSLNLYNAYTNMLVEDDTIYCFGFYKTSNVIGGGYLLDKLSSEGNLIIRKSYSEDSAYYSGGNGENSLMKYGKNILCAGASQIDTVTDGLIYKFDKLCDTLWVKKRSKTNALGTTYRYSIKTSESTFVALGDVAYYDSSVNWTFGQIYFVKFDTLANIIWEHELGYTGTVNEFVKGIYSAADGGFFIYGRKTNYQQWSECYLLKVDAMGNQVWQRSWGDVYHDELRGFYEMPNGNLLVSGIISDDYFGGEVSNAYLAMLTPDGSQRIWEKRLFGIIDHNDLSTIFKNIDGTYHIWGYESTPNITRPLLMHFSSNFDSLDTKYYSYWNGPGAQNYIRDIVKMPDQGYVACGFGWENGHDQDGWLLRLDSAGCLAKPMVYLGNDTSLCAGQSITLNAGIQSSYQWNNGSTSQSIEVTNSGIFIVNITNQYHCKASDQIEIVFAQTNILPNDTSLFASAFPFTLTSTVFYNNMQWSDGSNGSQLIINAPGVYMLQANDDNGCLIIDTISIKLKELKVPTIMVKGQILYIKDLPQGSNLTIYNSIGQIVYSNPDYQNNFNGLTASSFYIVEIDYIENEGTEQASRKIITSKLIVLE